MLDRIGINALFLVPGKVGGSETYTVELIKALAEAHPETEFIVFCGREASASLSARGFPTNVRIRPVRFPSALKPLRALVEILLIPLLAARERVQLMHSMGTTGTIFGNHPRVVTVHDLIFHHFPETFPRPARAGLELLVPLGARRSHRVIAVSSATKQDLIDTFEIDGKKIDVVLEGCGLRETSETIGIDALQERFDLNDAPLVLTVAAALAHKNLDRLFEAVAQLKRDQLPVQLALVGHAGLETDRLKALASSLGIADQVSFTGWVTDQELDSLYAAAECFVYPTLFEGFGLPVLEAMHRGVPVACSNTTSLPEVAGDAALLFDPLSVEEIADSVRKLVESPDLAADFVERGRKQAAGFTWSKAAEGTWQTYLAAVGPS